jgi:hypothetical protein
LVNETSDILREERIQKEMKNTEALRGRIQDLQSQSQLVREENRLYKQKLESLETLFRSQKNKKVALIRKIALLDPYRQIDRKLEALEEPIALIVNNENTNDNQYRPNGAHIDTIKVAEIKEEPLPCEMSAKRKHSTTASNP